MAKKRALVLGGGAPNFTLMSGALLALHHAKMEFDHIYMAGAGAVVGLVYMSPKQPLTPEQALLNTMNYGISDLIYSMVPINYKLFSKGGPSAAAFRDYWTNLPPIQAAMNQYGMNDSQKLASDWLLFNGAMICPAEMNCFSKGMCAHMPFIDNVVDFDKLKNAKPEYYLNAYCIEDGECVEFKKPDLDVHHFRAAMSFPFIYPPYRIGTKHYYEGAAVDSLNLIDLMDELDSKGHVDEVVVLDVMKPDLIHRPRNLWDAYAQSIIVPLVANAEKELAMFLHWVDTGHVVKLPGKNVSPRMQALLANQHHPAPPSLTAATLRFDDFIPAQHKPFMLDWSKSNLEILFDAGYRAGKHFVNIH